MKTKWMPIETAPRDEPFLAYEDGNYYKCSFWYQTKYKDSPVRVFYQKYLYEIVCFPPEPTHWRPLPKPPE